MIVPNEDFKVNIQFSKYARSGCIVYTNNKSKCNILKKSGWNSYCKDTTYRLNPPTLNLVDIVDIEKANQYQNFIFNYSLYKYFSLPNNKDTLKIYCADIIEKNKTVFRNFEFYISVGPILQYAIKIEGSDNRVYKLNSYLIAILMDNKDFMQLYKKNIAILKNNFNVEEENIKEENIKLQVEYMQKYHVNNYPCKDKCIKIDFNQINLDNYDYIIFILNGCFKILQYFDISKYKEKIIFWEIHMDESKGENKFYNIEKLIGKSILVIDSIYSGKTILFIKENLKNITKRNEFLGIFPKSNYAANICDYNIILNKVLKKKKSGINIEKEILKILGGYYGKNRHSSEI